MTAKNILSAALATALALSGLAAARAQDSREPGPAERFLASYLNPSVVMMTASSGKDAMGDALFYRRGVLARQPTAVGNMVGVTSLEVVTITNKFLPFTSNTNQVNLYGASFRVGPVSDRALTPYAGVAAYYGDISTERNGLDISGSGFVPAAAVGLSYKLGRGYVMDLQYQQCGTLEGVNFSGVSLNIRIQ